MPVSGRAYMADGRRGGFKGSISGVKLEVEPCPDCSREDTIKGAAVGGAAGFGLLWLLGASPVGRLIMAAVGAGLGAAASRYHVYLDWDPDRVRYGDDPARPSAPTPEPEAR